MKNLIFSLIFVCVAICPFVVFAQSEQMTDLELQNFGQNALYRNPTTGEIELSTELRTGDPRGSGTLLGNFTTPFNQNESNNNQPNKSSGFTIFDQIVPKNLFNGSSPLNVLLNQLFYIGLAVAVILAIVMIVRGGIEYMTVDSMYSKDSGKKRVQAALGGLLLAFSAILILNTINPNITKLNLAFDRLKGIESITVKEALTPGVLVSGARGGLGGDNTGPVSSKFTDAELEAYTLAKIKELGFSNLSPRDRAAFFPNGGTDEEWLALASAMIKYESGFNPNTTYTESFKDSSGRNVISTGLFQVSQESIRGYGYRYTTEQLKDPRVNIDVGLGVLKRLIQRDGYISGPGNTGGARYWSVLRSSGKLSEVKATMRDN